MGEPSQPESARLFCGILAADAPALAAAHDALAAAFGAPDAVSDAAPFACTDYYAREMGADLLRQYAVFDGPFAPETLARVKRQTNAMEDALRGPAGGRRVNLDPGYLTLSKLVLASTKDFAHRIYLGDGVHAEVTLNFTRAGCRFFDWTYPDYRSPACTGFLRAARARLRAALAARR